MNRAIENLKNLVVNPEMFQVVDMSNSDTNITEFRLLIPDINSNIKIVRRITEVMNILMAKRIRNVVISDYYNEGYNRVRRTKHASVIKYYNVKGHTAFKTIREIEKDKFEKLVKKNHATIIKHIIACKKMSGDSQVYFEYVIYNNRLHFSIELEVSDIHDGLNWLEDLVDLLNLKSGDYYISTEPLINILYEINEK